MVAYYITIHGHGGTAYYLVFLFRTVYKRFFSYGITNTTMPITFLYSQVKILLRVNYQQFMLMSAEYLF